MSIKILIADDEPEIRELLRLYLENEHYTVVEAEDGQQALEMVESEKPDLCILDIMMPKVDGYRCLAQIRRNSNIPVIILSAKDEDSEKILGLNMGADDYLAKPFNPMEAVARVNSNLRRFYSLGAGNSQNSFSQGGRPANENKINATESFENTGSGLTQFQGRQLSVRDLVLDADSCTLLRNGERIELTSVEYRIMEMFMSYPGKVFTKQQIYECGWGEEYIVADNNIMVCISKLRAKLSAEPLEYIKTIRGLGYFFPDYNAAKVTGLESIAFLLVMVLMLTLGAIGTMLPYATNGIAKAALEWLQSSLSRVMKSVNETTSIYNLTRVKAFVLFATMLVLIVLIVVPYVVGALYFAKIVIEEIGHLQKKWEEQRMDFDKKRNLMLSDIAHDLRTPMTTVNGYAKALAEGMVTDEEKRHEYLAAIQQVGSNE